MTNPSSGSVIASYWTRRHFSGSHPIFQITGQPSDTASAWRRTRLSKLKEIPYTLVPANAPWWLRLYRELDNHLELRAIQRQGDVVRQNLTVTSWTTVQPPTDMVSVLNRLRANHSLRRRLSRRTASMLRTAGWTLEFFYQRGLRLIARARGRKA